MLKERNDMTALRMITGLIGVSILFLVALALLPTVADQVVLATSSGNVTGGASALTSLITLLYVVIVVVAALAAIGIAGGGKFRR